VLGIVQTSHPLVEQVTHFVSFRVSCNLWFVSYIARARLSNLWFISYQFRATCGLFRTSFVQCAIV
jgi:hypothetical protein